MKVGGERGGRHAACSAVPRFSMPPERSFPRLVTRKPQLTRLPHGQASRPGSLYQFFPNKVAIGNALAERYMDDFLALWKRLATPEAVALPIPALVDYMIDPLNAFTRGKLGFQVVFASSDVSPRVAVLGEEMHFGVIKILGDWIAARAPHLPPDQCNLMAEVIVRIYKSFMPALLDPDLERGERLMDEMKAVLRSYLSATLGGT
jgi:AcrR family transcriptional regulator